LDEILTGSAAANVWIRRNAERFQRDLGRTDIVLDWDEVLSVVEFCERCGLIGDYDGQPFRLSRWQLWLVACLWGWKRADTGLRRTSFAVVQVGKGNGKTTLMAALGLYDLTRGGGREVYVLANKEDQAMKCVNTARRMAPRVGLEDSVKHNSIRIDETDSKLAPLTYSERSLDGLNPSFWIADEAAEFKGRAAAKLAMGTAKRKEGLGVIISTPGNGEGHWFDEQVRMCQSVLDGTMALDHVQGFLYGIDEDDNPDEQEVWAKANPGLDEEQPSLVTLKNAWAECQVSKTRQREWLRYYCCRRVEGTGSWLEMSFWPNDPPHAVETYAGRVAYLGLDLSKSRDLTALVAAIPLDGGKIALVGRYWWPSHRVRQREKELNMPITEWADNGNVILTPGDEIDYQAVRDELNRFRTVLDVRKIVYDRYGSVYLRQQLALEDAAPIEEYPQSIKFLGPACQVWENFWVGRRFVFGHDPVLRRCCADALVWADMSGNKRPVKATKSGEAHVIDGLMAGLMAVHCLSLNHVTAVSSYETHGLV
jgi:phage terminase large subunit-like protein